MQQELKRLVIKAKPDWHGRSKAKATRRSEGLVF